MQCYWLLFFWPVPIWSLHFLFNFQQSILAGSSVGIVKFSSYRNSISPLHLITSTLLEAQLKHLIGLSWRRMWDELVGELVLTLGSGTHHAQEDSVCISANIIAYSMDTGKWERWAVIFALIVAAFSSPMTSCHITNTLTHRFVEDCQEGFWLIGVGWSTGLRFCLLLLSKITKLSLIIGRIENHCLDLIGRMQF